MNPLSVLTDLGQSIWLDYIRRSFLTGGELDRLVRRDHLRGVTANPTIFEKAITGSDDYDEALRRLIDRDRHADAAQLYEALAIEDIQLAADVLRPVAEQTAGRDGFVSLEVDPGLAHDTDGTVAEARRLWKAVARPNLMIKVPATDAGIPAIERLIADGINVNVTLMFSLAHYEAVAAAYLRGLDRTADPGHVASVASFFVSRVDTAVDRALEAIGTPEARSLLGTIAIANAKRAYRRYREIFHGDAFARCRSRGANPQRVLWASTGTKNPTYSDVLYVEGLIGPETVNTMPPATLNAFRDHGRPHPSLLEGLAEADAAVARLGGVGIDLRDITERLQRDGVASFAESFRKLTHALEQKRRALRSARVTRVSLDVPSAQGAVTARLEQWREQRLGRRLWEKDATIWSTEEVAEISDRLGWLTLHEAMHEQLDTLEAVAEDAASTGIRDVVLLGMGGSSLAPEVFAQTFGSAEGRPTLTVLDSTHPAAVRAVAARLSLEHTLFLVSSKSGTTLETLSLFRTFWDRVSRTTRDAGRQFVAITDPDTPLEDLARERSFRRVFRAPPDVGGRYSALSVFGLVPAALLGVDVHRLLDGAWTMAEASAFCVSELANPGLMLGAALGELALAGRDKVTFFTSPALRAFPAWLEQLIAESTGKNGTGIIPVVDEPSGPPDSYGSDRFFVALALDGDEAAHLDRALTLLRQSGHPVARIRLGEKGDLGQEMFRWELAVAAASAILGVHPFDQPDVQLAKDLARRAMSGSPADSPVAGETIAVDEPGTLGPAVAQWLEAAREGDYVGIHAYLAPTESTTTNLQRLRQTIGGKRRIATTVGYGPRFLHSTGQLHKGGPNSGLFLQLVDEPAEDLPIPETDYTFGALIRGQALGDLRALVQRGRRVLRVSLGRDADAGLAQLTEVLDRRT